MNSSRNSVKKCLTRSPQQPPEIQLKSVSRGVLNSLFRNSVKTWLTQGPQQPIQKFSQNVTHAGSSTAYSEMQSKRDSRKVLNSLFRNSVKTWLTRGPQQPFRCLDFKIGQNRICHSMNFIILMDKSITFSANYINSKAMQRGPQFSHFHNTATTHMK